MINFNFNPHKKKKKRNKRIHALGLKTVKSVTYSEMFTILLLKKKKIPSYFANDRLIPMLKEIPRTNQNEITR